jgi:hypothetical protein
MKEELRNRNLIYLIRLLKNFKNIFDQQVKISIKITAIENRTILIRYQRSNNDIKINKENVDQDIVYNN